VLRNVLAVTSAGRYTVRVAITAYNCHDVSREDLQPAFLALVLAGPVSDSVNMAVRTLHMPRSIQARPRLNWKGSDDANRSSCSNQFLDEFPSRVLHLPLLSDLGTRVYLACWDSCLELGFPGREQDIAGN
jgi:hypothetical protein